MSWSAPRTWADGEIVDAATLNQEIRDNLAVLSTHQHGGGAGDGNDELDGVDFIDLDHISSPGAGDSGQSRFFAKSDDEVYVHPNGGSEVALSKVGHTHTMQADVASALFGVSDDGTAQGINFQTARGAGDVEGFDVGSSGPGTQDLLTDTDTYQESRIFAGAFIVADTLGSGGGTIATSFAFKLIIDGTTVQTVTYNTIDDDDEFVAYMKGEKNVSSGSRTVKVEHTVSGAVPPSKTMAVTGRMLRGSMIFA